MGDTAIEWTDKVWNPVTGCSKVSEGCRNCYAERWAGRQMGPWRGRHFTDVRCHPERLGEPGKWRGNLRVFVNSMSDLFHRDVPDEFIGKVWSVMREARQHAFQVLTKRPERMAEFVAAAGYVPDNTWLGVSVENQAVAGRVEVLAGIPARVRFVSAEPLLGLMDLTLWLHGGGLHWVIAGGESGPGARPMDREWARTLRDQCRAAGVPFFFKQWGEFAPGPTGVPRRVGRARAGRLLDGREHSEFPAW